MFRLAQLSGCVCVCRCVRVLSTLGSTHKFDFIDCYGFGRIVNETKPKHVTDLFCSLGYDRWSWPYVILCKFTVYLAI